MSRPDVKPQRRAALRAACLAGDEPAEVLDQADRAWLVRRLWQWGWTDTEIAAHTRSSSYTTARIRNRLGLKANRGAA